MVLYIFIDAVQQVTRQRDVELLRLAQILGDINVYHGPGAACVLGVGGMQGDLLRTGNRRTVFGQDLEVPFDGFDMEEEYPINESP